MTTQVRPLLAAAAVVRTLRQNMTVAMEGHRIQVPGILRIPRILHLMMREIPLERRRVEEETTHHHPPLWHDRRGPVKQHRKRRQGP